MNFKKFMALLLSLCAVLTVVVLPSYADTTNSEGRPLTFYNVYTPAGSAALALYREGEATADEIAESISTRARYGRLGAYPVTEMNVHYNCFSFAFLNQDTRNNDCWLEEPDYFLSDGSYIEIDEPVQGCLAVYFNENHIYVNTVKQTEDGPVEQTFYLPDQETIMHAALVVGVNPGEDGILQANEIELVSKWGMNSVYRHTQDVSPYSNIDSTDQVSTLTTVGMTMDMHMVCYDVAVKYYVPNPALFSGLTLQSGRTNRQGLYKDPDGIRYYTANQAYAAGVVSDANGHYYYIDSSLKAVKSNDSVLIPVNDTNGLIPDGVYSIDGNGYITNLPTVVCGESMRNGVVKMSDGQIKTMKDGYTTSGYGAYTDGTDYYYFDDTPVQFGTYEDGSVNFAVMTTDGTVDGTVSGTRNNGILPVYEWSVDENGKITKLPVKLDSQTKNLGTGLMRLPDNTIVLYQKGVAQVGATNYTDPATGKKYVFTYGGTTYSVAVTTTTAKVTNRLAKKAA